MAATPYFQNKVLDFLLRGIPGTSPSAWYVALFTDDPGVLGENECEGTGYVRKSVTFTASVSGETRNVADVDFGDAGSDWGTVKYFGIFDASTAGNFFLYQPFNENLVTVSGDPVLIPAGEIVVSLD